MRLPKRTQGLILGAAVMVAGPVIALAAVTAPPATPAAAPAAHVAAVQPVDRAVRTVAHPRMLRDRALIPPPTPVAPAPQPAAPVHHRTAAAPAAQIPSGPVDPNSVQGIIEAAAARWGVSGSWMVKIARCESGLNPHAYNPHGPYYGLFQFLMSTFTHNGGTNIWSAADQANIAAKMLAHGQAHQWSCA